MGSFEDEAIKELEDQEADEVFSWDNRHFRILVYALLMGVLLAWQLYNVVSFLRDSTLILTAHAEEEKADAAEWGRIIGIDHGFHKGFRKGYASRMSEEEEKAAEAAKANGVSAKAK